MGIRSLLKIDFKTRWAKKRKYRAWDKLVHHIRARNTRVKPKGVQGLFNFRCFDNCVQYSKDHEDIRIFECIYVDDNAPILHYVCFKDGEYLEVTLGWKADAYEYYITREVHEVDHDIIQGEFARTMNSWTEQFTNAFDRKVLDITRIV